MGYTNARTAFCPFADCDRRAQPFALPQPTADIVSVAQPIAVTDADNLADEGIPAEEIGGHSTVVGVGACVIDGASSACPSQLSSCSWMACCRRART